MRPTLLARRAPREFVVDVGGERLSVPPPLPPLAPGAIGQAPGFHLDSQRQRSLTTLHSRACPASTSTHSNTRACATAVISGTLFRHPTGYAIIAHQGQAEKPCTKSEGHNTPGSTPIGFFAPSLGLTRTRAESAESARLRSGVLWRMHDCSSQERHGKLWLLGETAGAYRRHISERVMKYIGGYMSNPILLQLLLLHLPRIMEDTAMESVVATN